MCFAASLFLSVLVDNNIDISSIVGGGDVKDGCLVMAWQRENT